MNGAGNTQSYISIKMWIKVLNLCSYVVPALTTWIPGACMLHNIGREKAGVSTLSIFMFI